VQSVIYFILVPMVYIACAIFLVGTILRVVKIWQYPKQPTTLQIFPEKKPKWLWTLYDTFMFPTVLRHKPLLWVFLIAFHISLVLLLIGHLELIAEFGIFQIVPHEVFIGNGYVGLTLAVCLLYFLFRRMISPVKDLSIPEDYYLLILLFLIVIFGSEMDWARRWYEYGEMTVEDYRTYLYSLLVFKPDLPYSTTFSGHSFMLVLHVFFANLFLMFFPFSQLMHAILSLPMNKLRRG
jgi:nitrate reductase gamma subunit